MRDTEASFRVIFSGPATAGGQIDVRDLAPALLALGEIFTAANEELNGDKAKSAVKMRATSAGSFDVLLNVWVELSDALKSLLDFAKSEHDAIIAANDLVNFIGKVGGGLLALLLFLRGRKPDKVEKKENGSVVIIIGDARFETNEKVLKLAESLPVREGVEKFSEALEREGLEEVSIAQPEEESPPLKLTKNDIPALKLPDQEEEIIIKDIQGMVLQIVSLSFKPDNKWRFSDGENTFTATIEDEEFLKEVANNERAFAKGDTLICDVRIRQYKTPSGILKAERSIIKVAEHIQAARQLRLL